MIALARRHYPSAMWQVRDIRDLELSATFDAILSWDGFFHLSVSEQRAALPRLPQWINAGGAFMSTIGHGEGEVTGTVHGDTVYHASLSHEEYHDTLKGLGFQTIQIWPDAEGSLGRTILLAAGFEPSG